jgi:carbohydrate diacid regulator
MPVSAPLDPALAQSIVDRAMRIIGTNVNVMDGRGVIVASGERERIGGVHQGALLVLARQAAVEIDAADAGNLDGARPGVNLPLRAEGGIVGCIGLSGAPDAVRPYAELVRLAAETMLEQARLLQAVARDARLREEIVLSLLRGGEPAENLAAWGRRLGVDPTLPRVAALVAIDAENLAPEAAVAAAQRLNAALSRPGDGLLVAATAPNELAVLIPLPARPAQWDVPARRRAVAALQARAAHDTGLAPVVALGPYVAGPAGLARSWRAARATLAVGRRRDPEARVHLHADLQLPVALDALRHDGGDEDLSEPWRRLAAADRQEILRRSLVAWFAADMQVGRAAAALAVHRNTLDYRLRGIAEATGIDLATSEGRVRLYLAAVLAGAI